MDARPARMAVTAFVLSSCLPFPVAIAAERPEVRRVRGIVHRHQRWTGRVIITGDVQILDAAVTILPGTIVEFAGESSPTVLSVGAGLGGGGRLDVQATPDAPVMFRSADQSARGQIRIFLNAAARDGRVDAITVNGRPAFIRPDAPHSWRNVHFANLCREAALVVHAQGPGPGVEIDSCRFTDSGPVVIETDGAAPVAFTQNRIESSLSPAGLRIDAGRSATPNGVVTVRGNLMSNGIVVAGGVARIEENQLIGPTASVTVGLGADPATVVRDNYVHCHSTDSRRYVFRSDAADVVVTGNVFFGGAFGVYRGTRRMSGNVFAGATQRADDTDGGATQVLVASLPAGAVFENNLLLGPAHSMLIPQPAAAVSSNAGAGEATRVRHNVFDGRKSVARVIHLNPPHSGWADVEITSNLFLHAPSMVMIESEAPARITAIDHNAAAPRPRFVILRPGAAPDLDAAPELGAGFLAFDSVEGLGLHGADWLSDEPVWPHALTDGLSIRSFRESLMTKFGARSNSPLCESDGSVNGSTANEPAPRIGLRPATDKATSLRGPRQTAASIAGEP